MTVLEPVINFLSTLKIGSKIGLEGVMQGAERPRKPVLRVMDRLVREGNLEEIEDSKEQRSYGDVGPSRRDPVWRLLSHPVYVNPKSPKRRTVRDRLWKAMRDRRNFTRKELARITGAATGSIDDYTQLLEKRGLLVVVRQYKNEKTYRLKGVNPPVQRPIVEELIKEVKDAE